MRGNNDSLASFIPEFKKYVTKVILVGETEEMLYQELKNDLDVVKKGNFEEALKFFKSEDSKGILLLSPSYPSFDQFKNYGHRGDTFKELARKVLT